MQKSRETERPGGDVVKWAKDGEMIKKGRNESRQKRAMLLVIVGLIRLLVSEHLPAKEGVTWRGSRGRAALNWISSPLIAFKPHQRQLRRTHSSHSKLLSAPT